MGRFHDLELKDMVVAGELVLIEVAGELAVVEIGGQVGRIRPFGIRHPQIGIDVAQEADKAIIIFVKISDTAHG